MRRTTAAIGLAVSVGLQGVARPSPTYVETPVVDGGTMVARVRFTGEPPRGDPLVVRKNTDVCGEHKPFQCAVTVPAKGEVAVEFELK
jgi:hypothetical protein